jgi:hypothetical protein
VLATQGQQKKLAIECKRRSEFINGNIEWAKEQQLERYSKYKQFVK